MIILPYVYSKIRLLTHQIHVHTAFLHTFLRPFYVLILVKEGHQSRLQRCTENTKRFVHDCKTGFMITNPQITAVRFTKIYSSSQKFGNVLLQRNWNCKSVQQPDRCLSMVSSGMVTANLTAKNKKWNYFKRSMLQIM